MRKGASQKSDLSRPSFKKKPITTRGAHNVLQRIEAWKVPNRAWKSKVNTDEVLRPLRVDEEQVNSKGSRNPKYSRSSDQT